MKKIIKLFICLAFLSVGRCHAQQEAMYTQYMFNQLVLNPAYTGIHEDMSMTVLFREQWVGFEGAPSTQIMSVHTPLGIGPVSLGGMFVRDQIGASTSNGAYLSSAYRIHLTDQTKMSFGLQANLSHYQFDPKGGTYDPVVAAGQGNLVKPNFGSGAMLHSDKFYIGLGIPHLINQTLTSTETNLNLTRIRHIFFTAGYVFPIHENLLIKPNMLLKSVKGSPMQLDLNVNALLQNILWVGFSYRSKDSFDALIQLQIGPSLQFGYGFDFYTTTDIRKVSQGSHELMVSYIIRLTRMKMLTPRYF